MFRRSSSARLSGGGYALPRFYPPLGYGVAAALAAAVGDLVLGVHLALLLSVVASGWAMYYLARGLTDRAAVGLLAALLYVTFPYRFTDVLQRSAVAESWTFVWFPLLLAGAWHAIRRGRVPWYFGPSVAGLLLTHTTTALYFAVVCAAIALLARRHVPAGVTSRLTLETLAGAALAAWFLVPQAWYLPGVWAGDPRFMWATPEHADLNRLTIDLLAHRFPAPNGLDLGVGLLGAALPIVAVLRWRRRAAGSELDRGSCDSDTRSRSPGSAASPSCSRRSPRWSCCPRRSRTSSSPGGCWASPAFSRPCR